MKLFRDIEAIMMAAFGLLCAFAIAGSPPPAARAAPVAAAPWAAPVPVVVITGKRLTPAEKRDLA